MVDAQTVYVDDSGTDGKSNVAAAAFCVSTVDRWYDFLDRWKKIADHAGFELKHFHMTEFAACRRGKLCSQCQFGHTSVVQHPWQRWTESKRENVLNRLAKALIKTVECGWGHAHTKEDYDVHVRNSPARKVAEEPISDQHFIHAIQRCGDHFADWRAVNQRRDRLKFVFDTASKREKREIAEIFFAAIKDRAQVIGGKELWFDPEDGYACENRRITHQLLSADMLAWTTATIRARDRGLRGRWEEAMQVAKLFASTEHIKMGYTTKETFAQWERDKLNEAAQEQPGISEVRSDDGRTVESPPQRDKEEAGSGERGKAKTEGSES